MSVCSFVHSFGCLCARWGVHACVWCLCYLHLIRFVYIWYVQRTDYVHWSSTASLTDWLIAWIEFFFWFRMLLNAFVFSTRLIHLFTINVRSFFSFFCWIDFSLSTLRICLCNGHLINDTRWWNVQYNYSIMCDFCAALVKSWTLNLHHVFWCNAPAHIHRETETHSIQLEIWSHMH